MLNFTFFDVALATPPESHSVLSSPLLRYEALATQLKRQHAQIKMGPQTNQKQLQTEKNLS